MYEVDDRDSVIPLQDVPESDVGAPLPALVASEQELDLIYRASEPDPKWDGTSAHMVDTNSNNALIATVRFVRPLAHMFGPPNDEAFSGHPLAGRGLRPYAAWEVRDSSWVRKLERMNSVHPSHNPERFSLYRHFIFAFHDTTFECISSGYEVVFERGSVASVAAARPSSWM